MSVTLYDKALVQKLNKWTDSTDVHVYGPDDTKRLFEVHAEESNDGPIKLPIICVRGLGDLDLINPNRRMMAVHGLTLIQGVNKSVTLPAMPLKIGYQLDIYARYKEEADEFIRNIVFNIVNYPKLSVTIPYNGLGFEHNAFIRMNSGIKNNSDIPERLIPGQFTRYTLDIYLDDAYLWDVKIKEHLSISASLDSQNEMI